MRSSLWGAAHPPAVELQTMLAGAVGENGGPGSWCRDRSPVRQHDALWIRRQRIHQAGWPNLEERDLRRVGEDRSETETESSPADHVHGPEASALHAGRDPR